MVQVARLVKGAGAGCVVERLSAEARGMLEICRLGPVLERAGVRLG